MEILSSSVATMPVLRSTSLQPRSRNDPNTKMAMMPQFLGFMLEAYDMAPVLVMAPILISVFASPKVTAAWQYTLIVFTYSITMASRPIASAIFGRYADNHPAISVRLTIGGVGWRISKETNHSAVAVGSRWKVLH